MNRHFFELADNALSSCSRVVGRDWLLSPSGTLLSLGLNMMNRVLVVGSATIDKIERSGTSAVKMGGVVTYAGIAVDVQGYTRRVEKGRVHPAISENLHDVLLASTIIKADRIELQAILDAYQMRIDEIINAYRLSEVVVTAGREGGYVALASSDMIRYESPRVSHVVDPTGAGDVFFAAYLVSRLREHRSVRAACKHAAFIAARPCRQQKANPRARSRPVLLSRTIA